MVAMTDVRLRPRFEFVTPVEPNDVLRRLQRVLGGGTGTRQAPGGACTATGRVFASSAVLKIPSDQVHFWSPQLEISVDPHLPEGSVVRGLFGPRPAIWSLFVALYVGIAFAGGMGVIYGYAQWSLGAAGHALWSGPAALAASLLVYLVARHGRQLGMQQMRQLRAALDEALAGDDIPAEGVHHLRPREDSNFRHPV